MSNGFNMTDNAYKIGEVIHYLLKKIGPTDKIKLIKLVYIADKYHLLHHGRLITNDEYVAMEFGPVGSITKNILEAAPDTENEAKFADSSRIIKRIGQYGFEAVADIEYDELSETDRQALDFTIEHFGNQDAFEELIPYLHQFPEWKQFETLLQNRIHRSIRIETEELFSVIDEKFNVSTDEINHSKSIYTGTYG